LGTQGLEELQLVQLALFLQELAPSSATCGFSRSPRATSRASVVSAGS
jgi:hypothetical protein